MVLAMVARVSPSASINVLEVAGWGTPVVSGDRWWRGTCVGSRYTQKRETPVKAVR
ncbi:hypothetical protein E2C01_094394 [Portunus trituberculatus]|uniref:Uncharacterized protein n=1 Tax=Portunus trituberculatus TaxID=210409 RepID=A0A5B7JX20_PORTR|nr:hypothetical protein [Portunus trituberculatus]